jgi:hypothetical protein
MAGTKVYLEVGSKKVFACAVDWPGWCRAAKDEPGALEALADYAARYAPVAATADVRFPRNAADSLTVVEKVQGSATTDFGAPGVVPDLDRRPATKAQAERAAILLEAAWTVLDQVASGAPASLRKGPRGGGRDRDKMVQHVLSAESGYARQLGIKHPEPALGDDAAVRALRDDVVAVLRAARKGEPLKEKGWPPRYAARRFAWHALDHAWEMQDRSET